MRLLSLPSRFLALLSTLLIFSSVVSQTGRASVEENKQSAPFLREANLLLGAGQSSGDGLKRQTAPLFGFVYFRAFTPPQPGRFVLRMLADALQTTITPSDTPLLNLPAQKATTAQLVRFGFSGCYMPDALWLLCMDDGPRVTWLNQDDDNAQVLGNFPLGLSVHMGHLHPISLHARAEFGWWKSAERGNKKRNLINLFWVGSGYSW